MKQIKIMSHILGSLMLFILEFAAVCNQDTTKLLKLVQCCQERATDIISTFQKNGKW